MSDKMESSPPQKKGCGLLGGCAIGCAVLCILGVLLCGGAAFFSYQWLMNRVEEVAGPYEEAGYKRLTGQLHDIGTPVAERTVFVGQVVYLRDGSETNVAIVAQMAEISGTINGNLAFYGQLLTLNPDAVITGDLIIHGAQQYDVPENAVLGEIRLEEPPFTVEE